MRALVVVVALGATQIAVAAAVPPKPSDVLKPPRAHEIASPITDRFALRGSYFSSSVGTQMRVDPANGNPGTNLSAEDDLGMSDKLDQARFELLFRLQKRSRLRVDYLKLTRHGDRVLDRAVTFGDDNFIAGDRVLSLFDWRSLNFTYLYSVFRNERFEIGVGAGAHLLNGEARAKVPSRGLNEEKSGVAVYPTLALDATWRISRRFAFTARGQNLSASVQDASGSIGDYHADVQYRWRRNVAAGLGYTSLHTQLEVSDADFPGRFAFDIKGPELFFRASF